MLRTVLALPKASVSGLERRMASESASSRCVFAARDARYSIVCLVVSVLPAPDSPDMTIDWLPPWRCIVAYARSATE